MKKILLTSIIAIALFAASCADDNSVTKYEGGNAEISMTEVNLYPENWIQSKSADGKVVYEFQWYQEFQLDAWSPNISDKGTVICYILNQYGAWESLPYTIGGWTEDNITYTEEFWYSYDNNGLYFDYRNTHPYESYPPSDLMTIKVVIIEDWFYESLKQEVDITDYNAVNQALKLQKNVQHIETEITK